jgi:hypothetical protein
MLNIVKRADGHHAYYTEITLYGAWDFHRFAATRSSLYNTLLRDQTYAFDADQCIICGTLDYGPDGYMYHSQGLCWQSDSVLG